MDKNKNSEPVVPIVEQVKHVEPNETLIEHVKKPKRAHRSRKRVKNPQFVTLRTYKRQQSLK